MITDQRIIFKFPGLMTLTNDPHLEQVMNPIPGWSELRTSYQRAAQKIELPPAVDAEESANQMLEGHDLHKLVEKAVTLNRYKRDYITELSDMQNRAQSRHDSAVNQFITINRPKISKGIAAGYNDVKRRAQEVLPELADIHTLQDALDHPKHATAYSTLITLAQELESLRRTAATLLGHNPIRGHWSYLSLLSEYEVAWPNFQRYEQVYERVHQSRSYSVPVESEPWNDTTELLRDIAARDLKLWAPTKEQYETEFQRLQKLAVKRQDVDLTEAKSQAAYQRN